MAANPQGAAAGIREDRQLVNRWWEQYEETAQRLDTKGDFRAADDIRTLVDGLRELEREKVAAEALQAELDTAKEALEWIGQFAAAHHHDQESHVLLHALQIDIPSYCETTLTAISEARLSAADPPQVTHGRHCPCSACEREDWTQPHLAPCGMQGPSCPPVYAPREASEE